MVSGAAVSEYRPAMPARGWRRIRAFVRPTSMKPRNRSDESSVRMRWIRCGIPGPISMRCTTARRFDGFSVNYVAYGGSVSIDPGCLDRFFLLQVPIRGSALVRTGRPRGRGQPSALWRRSCLRRCRPEWSGRTIARNSSCWSTGSRSRSGLLRLPERPWARSSSNRISTSTRRSDERFNPRSNIWSILPSCGPASDLSPVMAATLRESIVGLLLTGQRHNLSDAIHRPTLAPRAPPPAVFKRARDSLEAHAAEPLDLEKLAAAFRHRNQVAATGFQASFRRVHFGSSARYSPGTPATHGFRMPGRASGSSTSRSISGSRI